MKTNERVEYWEVPDGLVLEGLAPGKYMLQKQALPVWFAHSLNGGFFPYEIASAYPALDRPGYWFVIFDEMNTSPAEFQPYLPPEDEEE